MKTLSFKQIGLFVTLLTVTLFGLNINGNAQTTLKPQTVKIKLLGTSNVHDWDMNASAANSEAVFTLGANDKLTAINSLSFTLPAKNLKSEHKAMDNNTYKALNTDKNPNITFVLTSAKVTPASGNNYDVAGHGRLTVAGTTREVNLTATTTYNPADKSFTVSGSKKMKMTDFKIQPVTALFGTIKTGDDITINYNIKYAK